MIKHLKTYITDFIKLFFPVLCQSCGKNLIQQENLICTECLYLIPKTNFQHINENPVSKVFWGRTKLENACAFYFFVKGGILQKLLHKLKYKGMKEIGFELGKQMGAVLKQTEAYQTVDMIVPVPLHKNRQKKRGYNQSEWIGKGLSVFLDANTDIDNLVRIVETETQTKKSRFERWENVENIFSVNRPGAFKNKHILLVDDVITTGATLEACANTLLKIDNVKVSVAALGYTK